MQLSDFLIESLKNKGVTHYFGYQGTMISYFVDAIARADGVENHSCYNEQGAAFAACGLAQSTKNLAVAYATSGPGAVNLLSGVANAYFDSLPVLFITGQVNTYEYLPGTQVRQHSFQEADIVGMAKPVSKYAVKIDNPDDIKYELEKACWIATHGRPGSVLLDIPMNIQRAEIDPGKLRNYAPSCMNYEASIQDMVTDLENNLKRSERPVFVMGNGVDRKSAKEILDCARRHSIPVVTSLLGKDLVVNDDEVCFGYVGGAYGVRSANLITAKKADLLVCFGVSLVTRQTGTKVELFAPEATVIRFDIDPHSFEREVGKTSKNYCIDVRDVSPILSKLELKRFDDWFEVCCKCREVLTSFDDSLPERIPNKLIASISRYIPNNAVIATDVGQHMMWVAQSMPVKEGQRFLFSGGHGAMGYALPAAIGASYAPSFNSVFCVAGDGSFQMNLQELEWVAREQLPLKIVVLNNHALGMVRVQQKMYFNNEFEGTSVNYHYSVGSLSSIIRAYGIRAVDANLNTDFSAYKEQLSDDMPFALVIELPEDSFAYPKTILGNPIYNQSPFVPEDILNELIAL